jgi:hypothetical protein
MPLTAQDLSTLLKSKGDHFTARVALEVDLSTNGLGDEDILVNRRDLDLPLVGTLDEELGVREKDA